jgi:hypothetical protein
MIHAGDLPRQRHTVVVVRITSVDAWVLMGKKLNETIAKLAMKHHLAWWRVQGYRVMRVYLRVGSGIPTNAVLKRAARVDKEARRAVRSLLVAAGCEAEVLKSFDEDGQEDEILAKLDRIKQAARRRRAGFANAGEKL